MGVPPGWVTDIGLERSDELHIIGNGVVPGQAEHAFRFLMDDDKWMINETVKDDMSETTEKPRGACAGCKFEYQLGQGKGEHKGQLVVRKHLSRTGPGECEGSRKPPAIDLGEATGDADAWQNPAPVAVRAPEGEQREGVPPVFYASYDSDMAECGHPISEGDLIQSDGEGGWRCTDCIVEPEDGWAAGHAEPTAQDVENAMRVIGSNAPDDVQAAAENIIERSAQLPHDRGSRPETVTHIPDGHDFTDSSGATFRHGGAFDDCTTPECVQFRNRLNPPVIERLGTPEHACDQGVFMLLRNCPVHGVPTEVVAVAPGGVPVRTAAEIVDSWERPAAPAVETWTAPGPASAAELPPVHGQPEPKRDRWGRYKFNGVAHTRATTFAKSASSTHALSEWRERMVVLGLTMRRDLLAMAHGKHVKRDRTELNSIAAQAKDAAGVKVAANLGTAYHAFSERLDAGLMTLAEVPDEYRPRLAEYQQAIAAHGLTTRPEWIERSTAVRADQVAAELPVGGTLDRIFQLPNGELVIGDLKTGSDLSYGWGEIAVQLAVYAHGVNTHGLFDWNTDTWQPAPGRVRIDYGIVVHLPADGSGCALYRIDLTAGWRRAQVCGQVMAMQRSKESLATEMFPEPRPSTFNPQDTWTHQDLVDKDPAPEPTPSPSRVDVTDPRWAHALQVFYGAQSKEEMAQLYQYAMDSGKFTEEELKTLAGVGQGRLQALGLVPVG